MGSAAECHLQLLERQVYSVARLCPESVHVVAVSVTMSDNFFSLLELDRDKFEHVSLIQHVTYTATKP